VRRARVCRDRDRVARQYHATAEAGHYQLRHGDHPSITVRQCAADRQSVGCSAAISAARAPAFLRCVVTRMCREDREDRTVAYESPSAALFARNARVFGFGAARNRGHKRDRSVEASGRGLEGSGCIGRHLAVASRTREVTFKAYEVLDLAVHVATKLNRSHCCSRNSPSFSQSDAPRLMRRRAVRSRSPWKIQCQWSTLPRRTEARLRTSQIRTGYIAEMARATLRTRGSDGRSWFLIWKDSRINSEAVFPELRRLQRAHQESGRISGLYAPGIGNAMADRDEERPIFFVYPGIDEDPRARNRDEALTLHDNQSHAQYKTTL